MIEERPTLKAAGARWWHTNDYAAPNLSRASLGRFFHTVLSEGAQIGDIFVLDTRYARSHVGVTVYMTDAMKERIEAATRYRFCPPPKIVCCAQEAVK